MPFLELFDETLDINSTEIYDLSVQISPDSFSFAILDTIRNKFVLIRSFEPEENKYFNSDKLDELINKDDFLSRPYKKVNILMPSKRFTIIPAPLFDPAKKDEYFNFNHIPESDNIIITNKLNDPESFIVASVPKSVYEVITTHYPGVYPCHHIKPLFNNISHIGEM